MNFHRFSCALSKIAFSSSILGSLILTAFLSCPANCLTGQDASVKQAFNIMPKQRGVDFDQPTAEQMKDCKLEETKNPAGFVVYDGSGRLLRRYVDNDGDKQLDEWSYFKNGIEIYRDVDSNNDKKTDSYRWMGTGGTRWGIDPNQDGIIDSWRIISAEEVAYEAFEAIKSKDQRRFERLLITPSEFKSLGLGGKIAEDVEDRIKTAKQNFSKLSESQTQITSSSEWVQAGTGRPQLVPSGSNGNKKDIILHDHASVVFKTKEYGQLSLGSIVQVNGASWRLIELPEIVDEGKAINNGGAFFPLPQLGVNEIAGMSPTNPNQEKLADLYKELDGLNKDLEKATRAVETANLHLAKAKILEQFVSLTEDKNDQQNWRENLADSVASAYQSEAFPNGSKFLEDYIKRMKSDRKLDGLDYIRWRIISAEYFLSTNGDRRARDEAHDQFIEDLKAFQDEFKESKFAPDALTQIGIHFEVARETDDAVKWYREAVRRFPDSVHGKRAAGALVRLQSEGKPVQFTGQTLDGKTFNLRDPKLRDKVVVIHYWETGYDDGMDEIQRLSEKYDDVVFVGCNIDNDVQDFKDYLAKNRDIKWIQLHAPGSMEKSPLAHQLGIPSEPLVLLFDKQGNLVESDVAFADLDREIERQRRKK